VFGGAKWADFGGFSLVGFPDMWLKVVGLASSYNQEYFSAAWLGRVLDIFIIREKGLF
jgi:hypothetical protein